MLLSSDENNQPGTDQTLKIPLTFTLDMLKCVLGWCLPKDYQKLESPRPDSPVHVDINVEILDILSVNDKEFSITMSMYFRCIESTKPSSFLSHLHIDSVSSGKRAE